MKGLAFLVLFALGMFFSYPLFDARTHNECDALEQITVRQGDPTEGPILQAQDIIEGRRDHGFGEGEFATAVVKAHFPYAPAEVVCAALFWQVAIGTSRGETASVR